MKKELFLILLACLLPALAWAQQPDKKFQIGMRSTMSLSTMNLSEIDPAFDDLSSNGITGPHHSGVFFLYAVRPYLRLGFETLVGNSDQDARTTMNYQAAGVVLDFVYGKKIFLAGGVHAGPIIVNAMQRDGDASVVKAHAGTNYKSSGLFTAPYVGVGVRIKSYEFRLFVKQVHVFSPDDAEVEMDPFSATYGGLSMGFTF